MKKIILAIAFALILFSINSYAFDQVYQKAKTKTKEVLIPDKESVESTSKPAWELGLRLGLLDEPSGGGFVFTVDNYDAYLQHNLSKTLYAYTWFGIRDVVKYEIEGSAYESKWESRMLFAGFGVYLSDEVSVYAAGGKIWLKNDNGEEPELDTAVERGVSWEMPIGGNKLVLSYRIIDAKLKSQEDKHISEIQGDGSYSAGSIMFSVPIGN